MFCHSLAHSHSVSLSPPPTPLTFVPLFPLHLCGYLLISLSPPSTTSVSFPLSLFPSPFYLLISFFPSTTYFCFFPSLFPLSSLHLFTYLSLSYPPPLNSVSFPPPLSFSLTLSLPSPLLTYAIHYAGDEELPRAQGEWEYWRVRGSDAVPPPSNGTAWASGLAFLF